MSRAARNVIANFAGQGWAAFLMLLFIPVYVRLLGIEAYGLIGFYTTLQAVLMTFDLGLTPTVNRELARMSASEDRSRSIRDLVRTLEWIYWTIGALCGFAILGLARVLAQHWVHTQKLPVTTVTQAIAMMGVVSALQWPLSFYQGGLLGLQEHTLLNIFTAAMATFRAVGAVLVLWLVAPTVLAYFAWQIVASAIQIGGIALLLWYKLPGSGSRPRFDRLLLQPIWRFAIGMSGTSVVALLLRQLDKVVLSKQLTLAMFGYYMLASTIGGALTMVGSPIFNGLFPHFARLSAENRIGELKQLYHRGCQLMSFVVLPLTIVGSLFAFELVWLWTGNRATAHIVAPMAALLLVGTGLNNLASLPYDMQVAYGWTSLGFYKNLIALIVFIPALMFAATRFGGVGAAALWVLLNASYVLVEVPIMHRRILRGELKEWYLRDIAAPLVACLAVGVIARILVHPSFRVLQDVAVVALVTAAAYIAVGLSLAHVRRQALAFVAGRW